MRRGPPLSGARVALAVLLLLSAGCLNHADASTEQLTTEEPADVATASSSAPASVVTAAVDSRAVLTCRLPLTNVTAEKLAWIRLKDMQILTIGQYVYTEDSERYRLGNEGASGGWQLEIYPVRIEDSGVYQCHVFGTPTMKYFEHLSVVEPTATIMGEPNRVNWQGTAINLTCVIRPRPWKRHHVLWMHNGRVINSGVDSRVTVTTETALDQAVLTSQLLLQDAQSVDSGSYACEPAGATSDTVNVDVKQVTQEVYHRTVSGTQRPLSVAQSAGLLVFAVTATAFSNLCC